MTDKPGAATPTKQEEDETKVDPPVAIKPLALGIPCDWCQKSIEPTSLVKCRVLNCPSSYKLHRSCIPLAKAKGTVMVCSLCHAQVSEFDSSALTHALKAIPIWIQTLLICVVISIVPQMLGDVFFPHQMAKFDGPNPFARLFVRILVSWIICIGVVVAFFFSSLVLRFIRVMLRHSLRNLTQ